MKKDIHPKYGPAKVECACGNTFTTRSTRSLIRLEICSACHPFFTGKQKLVDTAGRVERFHKRFIKTGGQTVRSSKPPKALLKRVVPAKVLTTAPVKVKKKPSPPKKTP